MTPQEALRALDVLAEDAQRESAIVRESCDLPELDPADAICAYGYFAHFPHVRIDAIYVRNGVVYVDVSPAFRSAFEPCDTTTWRMARRERNKDGHDVEVIEFEEIEWSDGTKQYERGEEP